MAILITIIIALGILIGSLELLCMVCMTIQAYNLRKYGYWWGKLPSWAENIVDRFSI